MISDLGAASHAGTIGGNLSEEYSRLSGADHAGQQALHHFQGTTYQYLIVRAHAVSG